MEIKSISIIICCYNSSEVIIDTIEGINNLNIPKNIANVELLIVDNNCNDDTVSLINDNFKSDLIKLKIFTELKAGLMNARRKGVLEASGDITVFVDDDNILEEAYIEKVFELFNLKSDVGVIGCQVIPKVDNPPNWFNEYLGVYACGKQSDLSQDVTTTRMTLFGAGLSFRTELIKEILSDSNRLLLMGRTKNSLLRGDDSELCMQAILFGWKIWYEDNLILQHNILSRRINWEYVKNARFGGGMASIVLDNYRAIILGKEPVSYFQSLLNNLKEYFKFVKTKKILQRNIEGSKISFDYHVIKGKIYALLVMFSFYKYKQIVTYIKRKDKR